MPSADGERAPTGRAPIDWSSIEMEYRAGEKSIRQIASAHGCSDTAIRLRASSEGWPRELRSNARETKCEVQSAKCEAKPRQIGNGPGWGGPARGAGAPPFTSDTGRAAGMLPPSVAKADLSAQMRGILAQIATDAEAPPQARVAAADKLLDRLEGKPVQPSVNLNVNDVSGLHDNDLDAERTRLERAAVAFAAGTMGTPVPPELPGVVDRGVVIVGADTSPSPSAADQGA